MLPRIVATSISIFLGEHFAKVGASRSARNDSANSFLTSFCLLVCDTFSVRSPSFKRLICERAGDSLTAFAAKFSTQDRTRLLHELISLRASLDFARFHSPGTIADNASSNLFQETEHITTKPIPGNQAAA